jgi:hypothetical protein
MKKYAPFLLAIILVACSKPKAPEVTPTPEPAPQYGAVVPGKPGFVTSPYAPSNGYVDVRGFPKDTEVKDPYSGKIFLVP